MARAFLRYAPSGDLRPLPLSEAVVSRAVNARLDEIMAWLKLRLPTLEKEHAILALGAAMRQGGADGFRAATVLRADFGWPVDMQLCEYVRDCCNALAFSLRSITREWAVRVGLRFPGRDNDQVEWVSDGGRDRAGRVVAVDPDYAAAIVQPFGPGTRQPIGTPIRVFAEDVYANVTRAEYAAVSVGAL